MRQACRWLSKARGKITQHLLPRAGLRLHPGSLPGRKMSGVELSAHLEVGAALCQEAEAVMGTGEDRQVRTSWESRLGGLGWGRGPGVMLHKGIEDHLCRNPGRLEE